MSTEIWASKLVDIPYNAAHDLNKVHCKSTKEAHNGAGHIKWIIVSLFNKGCYVTQANHCIVLLFGGQSKKS